jgi:hypothetical protein
MGSAAVTVGISDCAACGERDAFYTDPRTLEPLCARCDQEAYDDAHDEMFGDDDLGDVPDHG